ncbi:MAG: hypothetical protein J6V04_05350 [Bacteroidales bacterium]|nr:hypothetical protein [Bacteroidales bacterium]MBO7256736.1 hypothetical protein [Bacteroidales bacterium]
MKTKITLTTILLLLFGSFTANISAQNKVKYLGEVDVGYSIGVGKELAYSSFGAQTVHGVKIGDYFSSGVGVALTRYFYVSETFVPVTLNLKGYLPFREDLTGFVYVDAGWGFGLKSDVSGFNISSGVGVAYKIFKFQLGYSNQRIHSTGLGHNGISLRLGFIF